MPEVSSNETKSISDIIMRKYYTLASQAIKSYYQEVGRAGRDGQLAKCFMFFSAQDFMTHREKGPGSEQVKPNKESMGKLMQEYLESQSCRRQFILNHFKETRNNTAPRLNCCDNCTKKLEGSSKSYQDLNERGEFDFTSDAEIFLSTVDLMGGKFGLEKYILFMRGSKSSKLQEYLLKHAFHGRGKHRSDEWWKAVARILEKEGYLLKIYNKKEMVSYFTYGLDKKGVQFLKDYKNNESPKILLEPTPQLLPLLKKKENSNLKIVPPPLESVPRISNAAMSIISAATVLRSTSSASALKPVETEEEREDKLKLYKVLTNLRAQIAANLDCMQYTIASNEALMQMATLKPKNVQQFRNSKVDQYTEAKISKFGLKFIDERRLYCKISPEVSSNETKSIRDIIMRKPLFNSGLTPSALSTYSLFEIGSTISKRYSSINCLLPFNRLHESRLSHQNLRAWGDKEIAEQIRKIIRNPPTPCLALCSMCSPHVPSPLLPLSIICL